LAGDHENYFSLSQEILPNFLKEKWFSLLVELIEKSMKIAVKKSNKNEVLNMMLLLLFL